MNFITHGLKLCTSQEISLLKFSPMFQSRGQDRGGWPLRSRAPGLYQGCPAAQRARTRHQLRQALQVHKEADSVPVQQRRHTVGSVWTGSTGTGVSGGIGRSGTWGCRGWRSPDGWGGDGGVIQILNDHDDVWKVIFWHCKFVVLCLFGNIISTPNFVQNKIRVYCGGICLCRNGFNSS